MPIDLVPPDLHRGEKKAIAELSAFAERRRGPFQRLAIGTRAVQQETEVVRPYLGVAGHRFAVQPYVVGGRAEQHVRHAVFAVGDGQFILVPVDFGPAVRAASVEYSAPCTRVAARRVRATRPPVHGSIRCRSSSASTRPVLR